MFKLFFWKVFLCVVPSLIALYAIWDAFQNDRFKLGVDLVGGTILVYEIDTRKLVVDGKETQDPREIAKNLAEKLKNRIDPNDLYNVVIRPAGGEGRVEIILPTGGTSGQEARQKEWDTLLRKMEQEYDLPPKTLKISRGQVQKLTDKILQLVQQKIWEKELYNTPKDRKELMERALDTKTKDKQEPQLLRPLYDIYSKAFENDRADSVVERARLAVGDGSGRMAPFQLSSLYMATMVKTTTVKSDKGDKETWALSTGPNLSRLLDGYLTTKVLFDYDKLTLLDLMAKVKDVVDDSQKSREIDAWFKQQAWRKMIGMLLDKYNFPQDRRANFERIAPDAVDELVGRVVCKGDGVGQAFLAVAEPLLGKKVLADRYTDQFFDKNGKVSDDTKFIDANEVREFILAHYGPSAQIVEEQIAQINKELFGESKHSRDLTVEEVQRIKALMLTVGSLEFRILANSFDDKEAIADATRMLDKTDDDPKLKVEVDLAQQNGLPPPPPREEDSNKPKTYTIMLRGEPCKVTYSWVELGPQERQSIGLNNSAPQEPGRGQAWALLNANRRKAMQIPLYGGDASDQKLMLQGALFYSRECQDKNLPEEERRSKKYEYFVLTRNPEEGTAKIDGSYLINAANQPDSTGMPAVSFAFNAKGANLFGDVTRKNAPSGEESGRPIKRHLAIILDGLVMSAPTLNSPDGIREHGQISGRFNKAEVDALVKILLSGALPATLKQQPVSENTMGATLGQDTVDKGLFAIGVAFGVVLLFMIVYYRFAGLVASVALLANLVLTVGFMVAVKATFTLPGLAGLVLMLGMAVDANILIYERLREERDRGASILLALRNGYDRALPTIIDTHLSSIFTAIVLYIVGNDQLKGFGVSLTVGLLISLYTSLFVTRVLFDLWASMGWLTKLSMLRFFSKPDIDFMAIRYYLFAATGVLTILGGALFIGRLPTDLNIDFVGGTAYSGKLIATEAKTIGELRDLLDENSQKQRLTSIAANGQPKAREINVDTQTYELWYGSGDAEDNTRRTLVLANKPPGDTPEERAKNVAQRASVLPDWAVEQIFLDSFPEKDANKSRFFTVRTTEKEPDIVQAVLDQLLQEKDKSGKWTELLDKVEMHWKEIKPGSQYRITFFGEQEGGGEKVPVASSPSFVTTLLRRQLMIAFDVSEHGSEVSEAKKKLPFTFELTNEDEDPSSDGRFKKADLSFIFAPPPDGLTEAERRELKHQQELKIRQALDKTREEFRNRPQPERLETFDSQLAAETRLRAMYAILLSWAAILLYLWFRFGSWTFGLAAVLCLIHDLFFTLGVIAICHYVNGMFPGFLGIEDFKIDLPSVAALLTLVGYSVNDTIVVFDRIREVRGKNPSLTAQMINDSVNQTLSRTLLSSLTTWLVVIVLYIWGGPGVHLFAFVMVIGVVVGTYSSIYVASPLLLLFGEGGKAPARTPTAGPTPIQAGPDVRIQPAAS